MAEQIDFKPALRDPQAELIRRLARAPESHAAALLDAYEILQLLHEKGVLEIAKGALGSGDLLLGIATTTADSDAVVTTLRNLTVLTKIVGGMNPAMLEEVQRTLTGAAEWPEKRAGAFAILRRFFRPDSLAALGLIGRVLSVLGRHLRAGTAAQNLELPHKPTRRHEA